MVYLIICPCDKYYVGRTENPCPRWSNHKSHVRNRYNTCNLASHCVISHSDLTGPGKLVELEEVKSSLKLILLEALGKNAELKDLRALEDVWRTRLESWAPAGLNSRED